MREIDSLQEFIEAVDARKRALGVTDDDIARARNSGRRRTAEKREFLEQIQERARERGVEPLPANF